MEDFRWLTDAFVSKRHTCILSEKQTPHRIMKALTDLVVVLEVMPVPAASEMPKKPQSIFL